jgi:hypothetical protein
MRPITSLALALIVSGCSYKTWWNSPFTGGYNSNLPVSDSENMRRVQGRQPSIFPLITEPGDIWPGPLAPQPTLKDLEATGGLASQSETPVPGSPTSHGLGAPYPSPNPNVGSSTQGRATPPNIPTPHVGRPLSSYALPPASPPAPGMAGQIIQTPKGPAVTSGGAPGYQTTTTPGGGQSIIVPNGNGTSTVIHADGRVETILTPK